MLKHANTDRGGIAACLLASAPLLLMTVRLASAGGRLDPRLSTAIEGLEVREHSLRDISITYEFRGLRLTPGATSNAAPQEFMHYRYTWGRKGRKLLLDETNLAPSRNTYPRAQYVYDGEQIFSLYYLASGKQSCSVSENSALLGDIRLQAYHLGLRFGNAWLPDLVKSGEHVRCLNYQRVGGDRCLVIELHDPRRKHGRMTLWLDVQRGFVLRKAREEHKETGTAYRELLASEPREFAPGVFLATRVSTTLFAPVSKGQMPPARYRWTVAVRDAKVGVSDQLFALAPDVQKGAVDRRTGLPFGQRPRHVPDREIDAAADRARALLTARDIPPECRPGHPRTQASAPDPECGAQSLYVICRQLGVPASVAELSRLARTTSEGTSFQALADAARAKGLDAQGLKLPFAALHQMRDPLIVAMARHDHFFVLMGFNGHDAIVLSPPDMVLAVPESNLRMVWAEKVLLVRKKGR